MNRVIWGEIMGAVGIQGEMRFRLMSDREDPFPETGSRVWMRDPKEKESSFTFRSYRPHGKGYVIGLDEIRSPEEARRKMGYFLTREKEETKDDKPRDSFYHHELIGRKIRGENNEILGEVSAILETAAHPILEIKDSKGKEFLLPFADPLIHSVQNSEIRVSSLEGWEQP